MTSIPADRRAGRLLAPLRSVALNRRCAQRLAELEFTPDLSDLNVFCKQLSAVRGGRPIELVPVRAGAGTELACGWWFPDIDRDLIFVKTFTSEWHQAFIVLHECSHMIWGHQPTMRALGEHFTAAYPAGGWDWSRVGDLLKIDMKSRYDEPKEQEADRLADLLAARAPRGAVNQLQMSDSTEAEVLRRFAQALRAPDR